MHISTDSWHYKLVSNDQYPPANLCPYMRALVWVILVKISMWACIIGFGSLVVGGLISPVLYLIHQHVVSFLPAAWLVVTEKQTSTFMSLVMFGSVVYILVGILALGFLWVVVKEKYRKYRNRHYTFIEPTPPGLVASWFKDFHDKTCTGLEFVDEDGDPLPPERL